MPEHGGCALPPAGPPAGGAPPGTIGRHEPIIGAGSRSGCHDWGGRGNLQITRWRRVGGHAIFDRP